MSVELSDGTRMPAVAFGFWQIPGEQCGAALEAAVGAGYRCLDFASVYGNEAECGEALAKVFASGKVRREDLYIITKLWATDWNQVDVACSSSLRKLRLDYVDLYLVHSAVGIDEGAGLDRMGRKIRHKIPYHVLWRDMEGLVQSGKTKSIGVSNWSCLQVADALNYATIPPVVNQLEIHPTWSSADLAQWCLSVGVAVMAYCPLGSGKPDMTLEPVTRAAARLGVSPAQVLLKWSLQKGYVPVSKSVSPDRMRANLALDFELSPQEVQALDACEGGVEMKICDHAGEFNMPLYSRL